MSFQTPPPQTGTATRVAAPAAGAPARLPGQLIRFAAVGVGSTLAYLLLVFAIGPGLASGSLAMLGALTDRPAKAVELAVLILANLPATAVRFLLPRVGVFRSQQAAHAPT